MGNKWVILDMSSFLKSYISSIRLHPSIAWSLQQLGEAKGFQDYWRKTRPEIISKLTESAIIQSSESSNRIEGVEVDKKRLLPLVIGKVRPNDRPEEEVVGYRKALQWIHKNYQKIEVTPEVILKIHKLAQGGMISDAGKWKVKDNEIVEFTNSGDRKVRIKCVPAKDTPKAIRHLCERYNEEIEKKQLSELLLIGSFILDFLCIHPFRDGNGRVSRLLTTLCLYKCGYEIGRWISLERIIETSKVDYYESLYSSSMRWQKSEHDLFAWWTYFLSHLKSAYQELKERIEMVPDDSKISLVKSLLPEMNSIFSIGELLSLQPQLDREIVKKALAQLKKQKRIVLIGKGRSAKWKKL
jgi:Fic family protein